MILRILHIFLACLVLVSTTGLTINKHYCKNELKNVAFFVKAKACHETKKVTCPHHQPTDEKPCCENTTDYFIADTDQVYPTNHLEVTSFDEIGIDPLFYVLTSHNNSFPLYNEWLCFRPPPLLVFQQHTSWLQQYRC